MLGLGLGSGSGLGLGVGVGVGLGVGVAHLLERHTRWAREVLGEEGVAHRAAYTLAPAHEVSEERARLPRPAFG